MRDTLSYITEIFVVIIYSLLNNKYCRYTSSCIMKNTFHISRNVCCYYISSYTLKNKYRHYT